MTASGHSNQAWLNGQSTEILHLPSVTVAELLFGLKALPAGKRNDMLAQTLDGLTRLFRDRVLPFDIDAARCYAELAVRAKVAGRGFIVASHDTAPYDAASLTVINPWEL